jgi:hypothetical protein
MLLKVSEMPLTRGCSGPGTTRDICMVHSLFYIRDAINMKMVFDFG